MSRTDTPGDPQFDARRLAARARLDAMDDAGGDPYRRAWFAAVYDTAGDDPAQIPWADLSPHPLLAAWLGAMPAPAAGARALDVGCGLGDNAAGIAARGFRVTAFDLSPRAIAWARPRFPQVEFMAADLFAPPAAMERRVRPGARVLHAAGPARRTARRRDAAHRCVRPAGRTAAGDRTCARRRHAVVRTALAAVAPGAHGPHGARTFGRDGRAPARSDRRQVALARGIPARLAHDPEKAAGWIPVFGPDHAQTAPCR